MADRSYVAENDRERRRLEALVGKLDDAALGRGRLAGWTVAAVLAHLAFWDQRIVLLSDQLKRGASAPQIDGGSVEGVNDAAKPRQLGAPPPRAARGGGAGGARAADQAVASLSDELLVKNAAAGSPLNLLRAEHRREHLDEIEHALSRG